MPLRAPLAVDTVPFPSFRPPFHCALAFRSIGSPHAEIERDAYPYLTSGRLPGGHEARRPSPIRSFPWVVHHPNRRTRLGSSRSTIRRRAVARPPTRLREAASLRGDPGPSRTAGRRVVRSPPSPSGLQGCHNRLRADSEDGRTLGSSPDHCVFRG